MRNEKNYQLRWIDFLPQQIRGILGFKHQRDILEILPTQLRISARTKKDFLKENDYNDSRISKFLKADQETRALYLSIKDTILRQAQSGTATIYNFNSLPLIDEIKNSWIERLEKLNMDSPANYDIFIQHIDSLIDDMHKGCLDNAVSCDGLKKWNVVEKLSKKEMDYPTKATCLTLIAATWYFWDFSNETTNTSSSKVLDKYSNRSQDIDALALIILPDDDMTNNDIHWREAIVNDEREKSQILSQEALKAYENALGEKDIYIQKNFCEKCIINCLSILKLNFVEDSVLGWAYYLLVKCHSVFHCYYDGYYNEQEFMHLAVSFGCEQAKQEWKVTHLNSLLFEPIPSATTDKFSDLIFTNTDNERTTFLKKTLPVGKDLLPLPKISNIEEIIHKGSQTYLLIDDNYEKNFYDTLQILQIIKQINTKNPFINWDVNIYLRTNEESYASLIDTALNHMDGCVIPIHILDDDKWAAQRLLSLHPLFYPIRSLPDSVLNKNQLTLHFVILCNEESELTKWLVRESSWMGTFRFHNLTLAITVLSPQADKINKSLHHIVPGLFDLNRKEDSIISAYKIDFICTELNSSDIETKLTDIKHEANDFFYFVIDIENDITSLNLAIKIREWCIRRTILSNNRVNKNDSPVIAFRCQNPDIAHLSASIVVQAEKHGNSWYNDYLIIPFGGIHESYSFDSLKREPFEKLAQCIHFQYSSLPLECSEQSKNDSLKNYYSRCYNRDSSFAVALSLPYRLFQVSAPDGKHIYPSGWDIINDEAYTHDKSLADMANTFDEQLNNETKKELAIYEHARWNRYMRARGWLPSTPDQTIKYIKNGNPKQQLYIGKLHSCICPWDDLSVLQKKLASEFELGDNKFKRFKSENIFTEIDISNVISTADILKTRWLSSKEEDKNNIR